MGAIVLALALLPLEGSGSGRQAGRSSPQAGISLAPSVIMVTGQAGQAFRHTLRLTNHTTRELSFRLEAQDVVVEAGRRVFVDAGERVDSIARTAVFSPKEVVIGPSGVGVAEITLTVPSGTAVRGVAAIFRGQTVVGRQDGIAMTASLGSLITFKLSNDVSLEATTPEVAPQSDTNNLMVSEWVLNTGAEPVVAGGAVAVVNEAGALVGRVAVEPQRLMPGERLAFKADYPTLLNPGRYRALLSLEYDDHERKVLTRTTDFVVPALRDDQHDADRGADIRR
jgi:hypothetical protein